MLAALDGLAPHWGWLSLAMALGIAEMLLPGFFLIWLAGAALVTGLIVWALPIAVPLQLVLFAVLAVITVLVGRRYLRDNPIVSDDPLLNDRMGRMIGQIVTLAKPIENGRGRARIGDSEWAVQGPDAAVGTSVRIVAAEGGTLVVEPV